VEKKYKLIMKIRIQYNKNKRIYIVKINNKLLFNYYLKKNKKNNFSYMNYNYNILLKILRIFGLTKSIYNYKDYYINKK
jgi:hypothetical protein